jgi:hypothetical protein
MVNSKDSPIPMLTHEIDKTPTPSPPRYNVKRIQHHPPPPPELDLFGHRKHKDKEAKGKATRKYEGKDGPQYNRKGKEAVRLLKERRKIPKPKHDIAKGEPVGPRRINAAELELQKKGKELAGRMRVARGWRQKGGGDVGRVKCGIEWVWRDWRGNKVW